MANSTHFSYNAPVFHGRNIPEEGFIVGYAAIIHGLSLQLPMPKPIALVCNQNKKYQTDEWQVFPKSYSPDDNEQLSEIN